MKNVVDVLTRNYWSAGQVEVKNPKKVYSAKLVGENGVEFRFKSKKGRVFFERRCDLTNAMNYALGCHTSAEWIEKYGQSIVIEERYIV